eukprot:gene35101-47164_t
MKPSSSTTDQPSAVSVAFAASVIERPSGSCPIRTLRSCAADDAAPAGVERHEDDVVLVLAQRRLALGRHHADDLEGHVADAELLFERVLLAEEIARHRLADDGDDLAAAQEMRHSRDRPRIGRRRRGACRSRKYPGAVTSPRHWLRASPDGTQIAFLMKDDAGVVQLWSVSPQGGVVRQITRNASGVASAFTWSPDGRSIAHVMDGSVCVTEVASGRTQRLTEAKAGAALPFACVFSPDGRQIAFMRNVAAGGAAFDIGSDWGGSIRGPAHNNGIAGIKPTSVRVPRTGHIVDYGGIFDL